MADSVLVDSGEGRKVKKMVRYCGPDLRGSRFRRPGTLLDFMQEWWKIRRSALRVTYQL